MYYLAPIVIFLGLTAALYKTQEVLSIEDYTAGIKRGPVYAGQPLSSLAPERQGFGGDPAEMGLSRTIGGSAL